MEGFYPQHVPVVLLIDQLEAGFPEPGNLTLGGTVAAVRAAPGMIWLPGGGSQAADVFLVLFACACSTA